MCQLDALQRLKCERSIILKALANLPKTLYETYDRIFLSIPEDECLFVHHVLQWIFYNNELYNGRGIRCSVLLQCVEISTAGIIDSQQDRYYDEETLRELCGCLINIESNVVSSAHYTVREYVDSVLMEKSARTYFKLCRLKIVELVLLQACQSIPRTSSALQDKNQQGTVIADLTDYCMVSALLSLRKWAPAIAQRDSLSALAFSLFDPAKPHLRTLVALVVQLDVNLTLLPHPYPGLGDMVFWGLHWELDTTDTKAAQLVNLLLWDSSKDLVLVHKFLRGITSGNIFERRLVFSYATSRPWGIRLHLNPRTKFDGSVIEFLTSFESFILFSTQKLRQVLRLAAGIFDPSMILLLYLQGHDHGSHCLGKPCLLKQLLDLGADPDGAEFYISPLQIAVFKVDSKAVAILLEAGADLNNTGNKDGFAWKDCSYMGRFNNLYGSSPRFILHHNRHVEGDIYFLGEIDKILNKYRLGKRPT